MRLARGADGDCRPGCLDPRCIRLCLHAACPRTELADAMFDSLAFDADDTLWYNETLFRECQAEFRRLLADYHDDEWIEHRLYETQVRNVGRMGYGVKSFTLSMVETAVELTEGRIGGDKVQRIIELGKTMLAAPVDLLDDVVDTLELLSRSHHLMLITKGDLLDQESKLERSGLRDYFRHVEVVTHKEPATYDRILRRHRIAANRFVMVGDSLRSDVLPVLAVGGWAIHIPCETTWKHELVDDPDPSDPRFRRIESIRLLPETLGALTQPA